MQFPKVFLYQFCSYIRLADIGERGKPYFMRVSEIEKTDETVISSGIKHASKKKQERGITKYGFNCWYRRFAKRRQVNSF